MKMKKRVGVLSIIALIIAFVLDLKYKGIVYRLIAPKKVQS